MAGPGIKYRGIWEQELQAVPKRTIEVYGVAQ